MTTKHDAQGLIDAYGVKVGVSPMGTNRSPKDGSLSLPDGGSSIRALGPASHTPGPWSISELDEGYVFLFDGNMECVANVAAGDSSGEANARLIAAAPALLNVAMLLVSWLDEEEGAHALCDTARAAIAKATPSPASAPMEEPEGFQKANPLG